MVKQTIMGNFRSNSKNRFIKSKNGKFQGGRKFRGKETNRSEKRTVEMHDVICDKCKKECQVPFKPSTDKPVYCSDCFRKNDRPSSYNSRNQDISSRPGISSQEFELLNAKLDKIMQALEIDSEDEEE